MQAAPARYFVEVTLAPLARQRSVPAPAPAPAIAATGNDALGAVAATGTGRQSDVAPAALEVRLPPQAAEAAIHLAIKPAAPSARATPSAPSAPPEHARAPSTGAAASHDVAESPARAEPAATQARRVGDRPQVIGVEMISADAATYTFPALGGEGEDGKPLLFKVERGQYRSIELAIVNDVIAKIRARYPREINWDSHRLGTMVRLSMPVADHKELETFLRAELFGVSGESATGMSVVAPR